MSDTKRSGTVANAEKVNTISPQKLGTVSPIKQPTLNRLANLSGQSPPSLQRFSSQMVGQKVSPQGINKRQTTRMDFLAGNRKPSSHAFPLMNDANVLSTNEELYEFENRLREVIAELTKPIYDK